MIELLKKIPETNRKFKKNDPLNGSTPNILIENTIQYLRELITCEMYSGDVVMGEGAIKIECYEECIKLLKELIYGK